MVQSGFIKYTREYAEIRYSNHTLYNRNHRGNCLEMYDDDLLCHLTKHIIELPRQLSSKN